MFDHDKFYYLALPELLVFFYDQPNDQYAYKDRYQQPLTISNILHIDISSTIQGQ